MNLQLFFALNARDGGKIMFELLLKVRMLHVCIRAV